MILLVLTFFDYFNLWTPLFCKNSLIFVSSAFLKFKKKSKFPVKLVTRQTILIFEYLILILHNQSHAILYSSSHDGHTSMYKRHAKKRRLSSSSHSTYSIAATVYKLQMHTDSLKKKFVTHNYMATSGCQFSRP